MLTVGVGVQVYQLTRLDTRSVDEVVEVLATDTRRGTHGLELAVGDPPADGAVRQIEVPGGLINVEPLLLAGHRARMLLKGAGVSHGLDRGMNRTVAWRDWSVWDRLDQLDTKVGIRKDRSPEEEAATTRRGRFILYGAWVSITVFLVVMGRVWNGVSVVGLLGLHRWLRRPLKF